MKEPSLAIVFTTNYSGYIREWAIKSVNSFNGSFELAVLLYRLNDWVPEVRKAAREKISRLLNSKSDNSDTLHLLLECAEFILDFTKFGRAELLEQKLISSLHSNPEFEYGVWQIIIQNKQDQAARLFKLSLQNNKFRDRQLTLLQKAQHQSVRRLALQNLLLSNNQSSEVDIDEMLSLGLKDRSIEVRRLALSYIIQEKPKAFHKENTYRSLLNQENVGLFDRVMFGLRSLKIDILPELRHNLKIKHNLTMTADLLCRWGDREDAHLLYEISTDLPPKEMISLLSASAHLGNEKAVEHLQLIMASHDDKAVASKAAKVLAKMRVGLTFKDFQRAIKYKKDIVGRGYLLLTYGIPTMEYAHIMALLITQKVNYPPDQLWDVFAKKRRKGMFNPTEKELIFLKELSDESLDLKRKFENYMGLKLL
ncbi:MAG: hypothetical protein JJ964_13535 [Rhizobiales bacterium]|nr:hypothetical protein [Hyphomicrobiales bacterium]